MSIADAVVLADVGHGDVVAKSLATRLGARLIDTVTHADGTTQITVESPCGLATSAATLG